jgi:hypothetical protein
MIPRKIHESVSQHRRSGLDVQDPDLPHRIHYIVSPSHGAPSFKKASSLPGSEARESLLGIAVCLSQPSLPCRGSVRCWIDTCWVAKDRLDALGHAPHKIEQEPPGGCVRVEVHCQNSKGSLLLFQRLDYPDEVWDGPGEAIQFCNNQSVALSDEF